MFCYDMNWVDGFYPIQFGEYFMENIKKNDFFDRVLEVLKNARKQAKLALNISMVYSYYEVGRIILEEEQNGEKRAEYGKAILKELSKRLTESLGKGFSVENLKLMRRFYMVYSHDQIGQKVSTQFENLPATREGRKFFLSFFALCITYAYS